jgi:hypothetical protein
MGDDENQTGKLKDYLEEELQKICLLEANTNKALITVDEAFDIYRQIQAELIPSQFDDQQIEEIIHRQDIEEETAINAIKTKSIVCPICMKSNLVQDGSFIYCKSLLSNSCSFKLDTSIVKINIQELGTRLENAVRQHTCNDVPLFMFTNAEPNSCYLIMMCESCQYMHSII